MKIGIIREGKFPPDRRVALLPEQCKEIVNHFPGVEIAVQPSSIRCVSDQAYAEKGFPVEEDIGFCDVMLGIKEVPIGQLISNKTYFFFSHTLKKQKYNRKLLQAILEKNITLIDYECLTENDISKKRIIAFGYYAGIVGAYNAFWTYGKKYGSFDLKRAYQCRDMQEMQQEYQNIKLPPIKIAVTGSGRVGKGAAEVLDTLGILRVPADDFLHQTFHDPVYTVLHSEDNHRHKEGLAWDPLNFHKNPQEYISTFKPYTKVADILITTAFWHPNAPVLFTKEEMQESDFSIRIVADISCDVDGAVPCTFRTSTIPEPVYDYNPVTGQEEPPFSNESNISVMAIDNLPCELPYDASAYFGRQFIDHVLPHLLNSDSDGILARATIAKNGQLTEGYKYLEDFVKGLE